ncbi:DUF1542 domain-containing protein, partial [Streptococcus pseudopneumoniae]
MKYPFSYRQRFSIRKFAFGAASVLLGTVFLAQSPVGAYERMQDNVSQDAYIGTDRSSQPGSMGTDRASVLNGKYVYNVDQVPIPDEKYNDVQYLLKNWHQGMYNWLSANADGDIFVLHKSEEFGNSISRKPDDKNKNRRHRLYKDEVAKNKATFDAFRHYPDAEYVVLEWSIPSDGTAKMRIVDSNNKLLDEVHLRKEDLWIRQSVWEKQKIEKEKRRHELENKKPAAKQAVQDAADAKKREIAANNQLTDTEKQAANDLVDNEVTEANRKIDEAGSDQALEQAK